MGLREEDVGLIEFVTEGGIDFLESVEVPRLGEIALGDLMSGGAQE